MTKRLFIAVNLPSNIREYLGNFKYNFNKDKTIRWLPSGNIHLTLYFLGETDESFIPRISQACTDTAKFFKPIRIFMKEAVLGPRPLNPRLIWVTTEQNKEMENFWRTLGKNLSAANIFYEDKGRKFLPHLTLARLSKPIYDLKPRRIDMEYVFNSFELMQSELEPHGAKYKILESFKLKT